MMKWPALCLGIGILAFGLTSTSASAEQMCRGVLRPAKQESLHNSRLNQDYFRALETQYFQEANSQNIPIFDPEQNQTGMNVVYPTAIAPAEMLRHLNLMSYAELQTQAGNRALIQGAATTNLYIEKMQAGTGSSIERRKRIARETHVPVENVRLGAKGTDLSIPQLADLGRITIAEAQIRQEANPENQQAYRSIHWVDVVSAETADDVEQIWKHLPPALRQRVVREMPIVQDNVPTMDATGRPSTNRTAPAGHGLFAFIALKQALHQTAVEAKDKIVVIANGEDLSGTPDPLIVGYMKANRIPILMITTDKTEIDLKGGQIALATEPSGTPYLTMIEYAQAEATNQKKLFEVLGLRPYDNPALFNTNMVLLNFEVLGPILRQEASRIGEDALFQAISPSLIRNNKTQVDRDGVERTYTQLEGAMGSMILNLDRYFRQRQGRSLVGLVNIERGSRTQFFAPIKSAFDYYMQFFSDRFSYDRNTHRLVDHRPGYLPAVKMTDPATENRPTAEKFYSDVDNVIATFAGSRILNLDQLNLSGRVTLAGVDLRGSVTLNNHSAQSVDLAAYLSRHPGLAHFENGYWILTNQSLNLP